MSRASSLRCAWTIIGLIGVAQWGCKSRPAEPAGGAATDKAGKPYALAVTPLPAGPGAAVSARITLEPRRGYKVNLEYPLKLTVAAPAARPNTLELRGKDAALLSEARVVLEPKVEIDQPGEQQLNGELRFSVCTEKQCEIYAEKVTWVARTR